MALSKSRMRLLRSLHHPKRRKELGLFIIEGPISVAEALREGWPIREVILTSDFQSNRKENAGLLKLLELAEVPRCICTKSDMSRIAEAKTPQGIMALAEFDLERRQRETSEFPEVLLICECISDPGNLGTLLRTADWFGVKKVILGPGSSDPFGPKAVRASAGSIFRVNALEIEDLSEVLEVEISRGRQIFAATTSGNLRFEALPDNGLRGLVVGHEKRGVSPSIAKLCSGTVRIAGRSRAESLNVSVATGILLSVMCPGK